jgi:hypothetical protein
LNNEYADYHPGPVEKRTVAAEICRNRERTFFVFERYAI